MNSLYILEVVETSFECLATSINQKPSFTCIITITTQIKNRAKTLNLHVSFLKNGERRHLLITVLTLLLLNASRHRWGRDRVVHWSLCVQIPWHLNLLLFPCSISNSCWSFRPTKIQFLQIWISWTGLLIKTISKSFSYNLEPNSYYHIDTSLSKLLWLRATVRKFPWQKIGFHSLNSVLVQNNLKLYTYNFKWYNILKVTYFIFRRKK